MDFFRVESISEFIELSFYLVAICVAILGATEWRTKISGQEKHRVAKDLLLVVYQIKESIRMVRNPFMFQGEMFDEDNPPKKYLDSTEQDHFNATARAYQKRLRSMYKYFPKLELLFM